MSFASGSGSAIKRIDTWIAIGVGVGVFVLLALTASHGFVRDEGYYFRAAGEYHTWFEGLGRNLLAGKPGASFTDAELRRAFGYNTEHPGLVKILMGFTWRIFHHVLGWTSAATGYRLASILLVALGCAFTYLLGRRLAGEGALGPTSALSPAAARAVGLGAVVLLMLCPHVSYHSHLACFDGPIMGLTVVVVYAFYRSLRSRAWVWGAGLAWGAAIATKHNAVFLLPTLVLAYGLARLAHLRWSRGALQLPPVPAALLAMALLGPLVFYLFYPFGWHDPLQRIGAYYRFHLYHEHYPVDYFGTLYTAPPFPVHFPFVMSVITVPIPILGAGLMGCVAAAWGAVRGSWLDRAGVSEGDTLPAWLLVINTAVPPLIIAFPSVPIFGGTKHWMTMMPFFCILAAVVAVKAIEAARSLPRVGSAVAAMVLVLLLGLPAYDTVRTHPLGHTYFNDLIGGHPGAAAAGMPRTFWGGDARELLPLINRDAERGARIFTDRMNQDDFVAYQRDGLLRPDLRWVHEPRLASWALINHQREYVAHEYAVWREMGHRKPEAVVSFDGVPIVSLYRLR